MLPEILADRLLQDPKATHHLELAGPPSRRIMFRKGKSRGGWEGWGRAGQRAEVSFFYILYFNIFIYAMIIERGQRDSKRKHY